MSKNNHQHPRKQTENPTNIKYGKNAAMEFRRQMFLQTAIRLTVLILGTTATGQHFPSDGQNHSCVLQKQVTHRLTILCPRLSVGGGVEGRTGLAEYSLERGRGLCTEKHPLANFLSCERINDSRM